MHNIVKFLSSKKKKDNAEKINHSHDNFLNSYLYFICAICASYDVQNRNIKIQHEYSTLLKKIYDILIPEKVK